MKILYHGKKGVPVWLARVLDTLFYEINKNKATSFSMQLFLDAIKPGMLLDALEIPFKIYILQQVLATFNNKKYRKVSDYINQVINLYSTEFKSYKEFESAQLVIIDFAAKAGNFGINYPAWCAKLAVYTESKTYVNFIDGAAASEANFADSIEYGDTTIYDYEVRNIEWGSARVAAYEKYANKLLEMIKDLQR